MIARAPGLIAHVIEEQTHERPMRRIDPVNHGYDGPPPKIFPASRPRRTHRYGLGAQRGETRMAVSNLPLVGR